MEIGELPQLTYRQNEAFQHEPGDVVLVARADGRLEFFGNFPHVEPDVPAFVGQTFVIAAVSRYVNEARWTLDLLSWLHVKMESWQERKKSENPA